MEIMIEISLYLIAGILLGFIFGWLIAKESEKKQELKKLYIQEEKFIKTKDDIIEKLTFKLSLEEEKVMSLKKEHEQEISAFLFERTDITQKYKELLAKIEEIKKSQIS